MLGLETLASYHWKGHREKRKNGEHCVFKLPPPDANLATPSYIYSIYICISINIYIYECVCLLLNVYLAE